MKILRQTYFEFSPIISIKPMQWSHIDSWRNYHKKNDDEYLELSFPLSSWGQMVRESTRRRKLNPQWNHVKYK